MPHDCTSANRPCASDGNAVEHGFATYRALFGGVFLEFPGVGWHPARQQKPQPLDPM